MYYMWQMLLHTGQICACYMKKFRTVAIQPSPFLYSSSLSMSSLQQALSFVDGVSYKDYVLGFSCAVYAFEQYLK